MIYFQRQTNSGARTECMQTADGVDRGLMIMKGNFGFIHEKLEIKILILFILRRLPEPVALETLAELAMCDDGISYFDFTQCVAELVRTEHLYFRDNMYSLTSKGMHNGEITEINLPYSVRMKSESAAAALRSELSRDAMIKTVSAVNPDGGLTVSLSLSDGLGSIMKMEMFSGNEQQAAALEKGFRKNAETIYNALLEMLLGN